MFLNQVEIMTAVDEEMTKEAFRILHYLVENNLERLLGPLFEGKVSELLWRKT